MSLAVYEVYRVTGTGLGPFAIDPIGSGVADGNPRELVKVGRKVRQVEVTQVTPSSLPLNIHFGDKAPAIPSVEGKVWGDDGSSMNGRDTLYDGGLSWSVDNGTSVVGASFVLTVWY